MPHFSKGSQSKKATVNRNLQILFDEVIKYFDCTVIFGRRTKAQQDEIFKDGREFDPVMKTWRIVDKDKITTWTPWPKSKHNINKPDKDLLDTDLADAIDVAPYIASKGVVWQKSQCYYFGGFVMGIAKRLFAEGKITQEIIYGGDWDGDTDVNDQSFLDLVHFQVKR